MTEDEYIATTNLAKIRTANRIVRDLLPQSDRDETDLRMALKALELWTARLEKVVKTEVSPG